MKAQPPKVAQNVYRDLRDRRLLSIAAVLVLAIIAVPFLLGGGEEADVGSSPAPGAAAASAPPLDGVEQIEPVVLTDVPGLRDFRERLDRYRSRNPFKQQLTALPPAARGGLTDATGTGTSTVAGTSTGTSTTAGTSTAAATDPAASSVTATTPTDTTPTDTPAPPPDDPGGSDDQNQPGGSGGSSAAGGAPGTGGAKLVTYTLDVSTGPVGETRTIRDVRSLDILPSRANPIVQYLEGSLDGSTASFVVSPQVVSVSGDGRCSPAKQGCQFLLMKEGDSEAFVGSDGRRYSLRLRSIDRHVQDLERSSGAERPVPPGYDATSGRSNLTGG